MVDQLPRLQQVRREPVASEVARLLLDYIFAGNISPGDKMPSERQLSQQLGTGRATVREALKALALLGLVDFRQGSGTYLRAPDSELLPRVIEWGLLLGERRVLDLVEARRPLEIAIAELAAERRGADDIRDLKKQLQAMERAKTPTAFVEADVAFHRAVADASGNSVLTSLLTGIQSLQRVWIMRVIDSVGGWQVQAEQHRPILTAIERGDAVAANAAMVAHMNGAQARLKKALDDQAATESGAAAS